MRRLRIHRPRTDRASIRPAARRWIGAWAGLAALLLSPLVHAGLLEEVHGRLAAAPVLRGEFVQTRQLAGIRKPLRAEGHFLVLRGRGVLWQTDKPFAQTLRVTEREILQRDASGNTTRLAADKEPVVATISQVLSGVMAGEFGPLSRLFSIAGSVEGARWQLVLTPREAGMRQLIAEIQVAGGAQVDSVSLLSASGDRSLIEMRRVSAAAQPAASEAAAFE